MNYISALLSSIIFCTAVLSACGQNKISIKRKPQNFTKKELEGYQTAYFASGCFWCVEGVFESVIGVKEVVSGYTGGMTENPTYEEVCTGTTGHAESVKIYYDSTKVSYDQLLTVFFGSHDPSLLNRQGPDSGTQYRSAIFYTNKKERELAKKAIDSLLNNNIYQVVTTELAPLTVFYEAEIYHQNFECRNPSNPYVQRVSLPRINQFKSAFPTLVKPELKP